MRVRTEYILGGLALGLLFFRSKFNPIVIDPNVVKRYVNRLLINLVNIRIQGGTLLLTVRVDNPNPTAIAVQSIVGQVYFKNQLLGDVAYYSAKDIPALRSTQMVLGIRIKNPNAMLWMTDLVFNRMGGQEIKFVGNVSVNGQVLAVSESFKLR